MFKLLHCITLFTISFFPIKHIYNSTRLTQFRSVERQMKTRNKQNKYLQETDYPHRNKQADKNRISAHRHQVFLPQTHNVQISIKVCGLFMAGIPADARVTRFESLQSRPTGSKAALPTE